MEATQCPYKMREELETLPRAMEDLLIDKRGYPIPYFVDYLANGEPEFRAMDAAKILRCLAHGLCWTCGKPLYDEKVFVIGPMCAVNRINSEPPNHRQCAQYSARNCPFLSRPHMVRRDNGLPEEIKPAAGISIQRNPGATCLWFTKTFKPFRVPAKPPAVGGILFELGKPFKVEWYCEGRPATRAEVLGSIDSGLPLLHKANALEPSEELRAEGLAEIERRYAEVQKLLPKV